MRDARHDSQAGSAIAAELPARQRRRLQLLFSSATTGRPVGPAAKGRIADLETSARQAAEAFLLYRKRLEEFQALADGACPTEADMQRGRQGSSVEEREQQQACGRRALQEIARRLCAASPGIVEDLNAAKMDAVKAEVLADWAASLEANESSQD